MFVELSASLMLAVAVCACPALFFVAAWYGGHVRAGRGPMVLALEWVGFVTAAQTLAAWAFAVLSFATLAPRATFSDSPSSRSALVPFVWCALFLAVSSTG